MSHAMILIMMSQIWQIIRLLKIQKLEYLENGTHFFYKTEKSLTCDFNDAFCEFIDL